MMVALPMISLVMRIMIMVVVVVVISVAMVVLIKKRTLPFKISADEDKMFLLLQGNEIHTLSLKFL